MTRLSLVTTVMAALTVGGSVYAAAVIGSDAPEVHAAEILELTAPVVTRLTATHWN
jgi:hypothetical protein